MLPIVKPTGDYDRDITGGFFPRPAGELPPGVFDARHLPGKHDQKTHGHGHGHAAGGGYKPGNWKKVSHEDRVDAQLAALEEEVSPAVKAKHGPEGLRRHAELMVGTEGTIYTNGEHKVFITSKNLTDAEHKDVLSNVDELQKLAPLDKPLNLVVAPKGEFKPFVGGETHLGTGNIRLNETVYTEYDRTGLMWGTDNWSMPIHERVSVPKYVLAHEWGHAQDREGHEIRLNSDKGMSRYGLTDKREGFAEAFAEFTLTGGKTSNPAAQAYASLDDWGEKWPSLATTSSMAA